jgi:hypothetical protein
MSWSFGEVGPGMLVGEGRDWVVRAGVNILKTMGCHSSQQAHHARSSDHAFSARLECSQQTASIMVESLSVDETSLSVRSVRECSALPAADDHHDDDPRIMIGLSPRYYSDASTEESFREGQAEYTARVLSTPLIWEEPSSYFFECSKAGVYLWSADGVRYGNKVLDKCLTEKAVGSGTYSAPLSLSWGTDGTKPFLELGVVGEGSYRWFVNGSEGTGGVFSPKAAAPTPCPFLSGDLLPTVTFLTANCRASVC